MSPQTYQVDYPTTGDQERSSLVKINRLLYAYIYGTNGGTRPPDNPASFDELISAVKGEDAVLATSGAFVNSITIFSGPLLLWQLDCFSIAPALEWVFVQDSASLSLTQKPVYIAPIYPNMGTSFMVTAPFQNGVTVGLSTFPNVLTLDPNPNMLVTAVRRNG